MFLQAGFTVFCFDVELVFSLLSLFCSKTYQHASYVRCKLAAVVIYYSHTWTDRLHIQKE